MSKIRYLNEVSVFVFNENDNKKTARVKLFITSKQGNKFLFNKFKITALKRIVGSSNLQKFANIHQKTLDNSLCKWNPVTKMTYVRLAMFFNLMSDELFAELYAHCSENPSHFFSPRAQRERTDKILREQVISTFVGFIHRKEFIKFGVKAFIDRYINAPDIEKKEERVWETLLIRIHQLIDQTNEREE